MVVKVEEYFEKTTTNLKNTFYVERKMQDIMKKNYQLKINLIISILFPIQFNFIIQFNFLI